MNRAELARSLFLRRTPVLLYHKPTLACDCRCTICDTWRAERKTPLSIDALERLLAEARAAGIQHYTAWGGEPLLFADLPRALGRAKNLGMGCTICTNGGHLEERAREVGPHLDLCLVSLDAVGADHDAERGSPGLFDRAVAGIRALGAYPRVRVNIWTAVSRVTRGHLRELLLLARDLGVVVEPFPLAPIAGYNDAVRLTADETKEAFRELKALKQEGLPVASTDSYLDTVVSGRPFYCNFPRIGIFLNPDGALYTCEEAGARVLLEWGRWPEVGFAELFGRADFRRAVRELGSCNRCFLPCVGETAGFLPVQLARKKLLIARLARRARRAGKL